MTALRAAFENAGYRTVAERRDALADAALDKFENWAAQRQAFYDAVAQDPGVLMLIFKPWERAIGDALADRARQRREKARQMPAGGGRTPNENQGGPAPAGAVNMRGLEGDLMPPAPIPKAVRLEASIMSERAHAIMAERRTLAKAPLSPAALATHQAVARSTILDTFKINGRSIRVLTAGEASAWARTTGRDAKFVQLLTSGLQPTMVIGDYRSAQEADLLMQQAREIAYA